MYKKSEDIVQSLTCKFALGYEELD